MKLHHWKGGKKKKQARFNCNTQWWWWWWWWWWWFKSHWHGLDLVIWYLVVNFSKCWLKLQHRNWVRKKKKI